MRFDDLSQVEAWSGGAVLPPGWHDVKVVSGEETQAKTGTDQWKLVMENEQGQITDWVAITPNTKGRVKGILECAGIQIPAGEFDFVPSGLVGKSIGVHVKEEPKLDGSGTRPVVDAYRAAQNAAQASSPAPSQAASTPDDSSIPF